MSELVVPAHLAGGQIQRDQAGAELLGARGAVGAPLVRGLVAQWQVDHAEFFVDAGQRPHVGRVAAVVFALWQRFGRVGIVAVPVPHQMTVVYVKGTDHAGWLVGRLVVGDVAAHDHQITSDRCWRGGVVAAGGERADALSQVNHTVGAEVFADLAGVGVECDQACIGGWQVQATRASLGNGFAGLGNHCGGSAFRLGVGCFVVVRHATAGHVGEALEAHRALDLRVETPQFLAGVRVQRQHFAMGGAGIEHAVGLERGVFVGQFHRVIGGWQIAGLDTPGFLQLADVGRGDLLERRVAVTEFAAAIGLPVAFGHLRRGAGHVRGVAAQFAQGLARVGELAGHGGDTGQDHGHAQGASAHRGRAVDQQWTTEPRQQHHHTEGEPQRQARHQLPPVEADFPQRPNSTGEQHQCVQAQRRAAGGDQQHAAQHNANAGQQVVQRAAEHAQLDPPGQHGQAH
ncbi:hypothetical protein D3C81_957900 [compost metagenome]